MTPMTTCLARLGSRFSLQFDPIRRHLLYGAVGLFHQRESHLICELRDDSGITAALPLAGARPDFDLLAQTQTMTSLRYEAKSLRTGADVQVEFHAPFLPQDEKLSTAPVYLVKITIAPLRQRLRWQGPDPAAVRRGRFRFELAVPDTAIRTGDGCVDYTYETTIRLSRHSGEGGIDQRSDGTQRTCGANVARCTGQVAALAGPWQARDGGLELAYDLADDQPIEAWLAITGWFGDPCFEGHRTAGPLVYTRHFGSAAEVTAWARTERSRILAAGEFVDSLISDSSLPRSLQDLIAFSFQSYLSCTVWADLAGQDWFSVWEGSCWYNSTVDVEYNNGLVYFGLWPELLETTFAAWRHHLREAESGAWLEHDMGAGWTCNGQSYHHPMEVEENCNWLLMLYAHGRWWGREGLFSEYREENRRLVEYLLWADSNGSGFPDRGTANTIDDATPAVQYGREQVYLGVKRLAALHAARRMFEASGDHALADRCAAAVDQAVATLQAGWLGDHYPVCLDRSAAGLVDAWSHQPLPYDELPGWDAYSLYTTNGLLYLFMVDDLPPGLDIERLRIDVRAAYDASLTEYGCTHSSADRDHLWVSMNLWRDQVAAYLGDDLLGTAERYWQMQIAANAGFEAKCFVDTNWTNNLCNYPRGITSLGAVWAAAGLRVSNTDRTMVISPASRCRVPLLPAVDWANLRAPWLVAEPTRDGLEWSIEQEDLLAGWEVVCTVPGADDAD